MLVVCNGMPRAGSTLQYNAARLIIAHTGNGRARGYFAGHDLRGMADRLDRWRRDSCRHLIKTHDLLPLGTAPPPNGHIKICYIYRNLYDVAASLRQKFDLADADLIHRLDASLEVHAALAHTPGVLIQRYEEVTTDLGHAVRQLAEFLGVSIAQEAARRIADQCSIARMKHTTRPGARIRLHLWQAYRKRWGRQLRLNQRLLAAGVPGPFLVWLKSRLSGLDNTTLLHPAHISPSNGQNGRWRELLDDHLIRLIQRRFGKFLTAHGYGLPFPEHN